MVREVLRGCEKVKRFGTVLVTVKKNMVRDMEDLFGDVHVLVTGTNSALWFNPFVSIQRSFTIP